MQAFDHSGDHAKNQASGSFDNLSGRDFALYHEGISEAGLSRAGLTGGSSAAEAARAEFPDHARTRPGTKNPSAPDEAPGFRIRSALPWEGVWTGCRTHLVSSAAFLHRETDGGSQRITDLLVTLLGRDFARDRIEDGAP